MTHGAIRTVDLLQRSLLDRIRRPDPATLGKRSREIRARSPLEWRQRRPWPCLRNSNDRTASGF